MLVLLISCLVFGHQSLADDSSEIDFDESLSVGHHLSCQNEPHFPALHVAAMTGNVRMATRALYEMKDSGRKCIEHRDCEGMTALHWAALRGHDEIVRSLLEYGANVSDVNKCNNTALHMAMYSCNVKTVRWLVMYGVDINAKNQNGSTALHIAVEKGEFTLVEFLIRHCASVNVTDCKGRTPLDLAMACKHVEIIILLKASGASSASGVSPRSGNGTTSEQYHWINKTRNDFNAPSCAVRGGNTYGRHRILLAQITYKNCTMPAFLVLYHKKVIAVVDGSYKEVKGDYRLLCGDHLAWKPKKAEEKIPRNALIVSTTKKGEKLYFGRAFITYNEKEVMTPGVVCGKDNILRMPFYSNDSIVTAKDYEILIVSP